MGMIAEIIEEAAALEGLADLPLSMFLAEEGFSEDGFRFRSVEGGLVTFDVPPQECKLWYADDGWPSGTKKTTANEVAGEFKLLIYEPPDSLRHCHEGESRAHHHFEFFAQPESQLPLARVHPRYLQIRILGALHGIDPEDLFRALARFYTS